MSRSVTKKNKINQEFHSISKLISREASINSTKNPTTSPPALSVTELLKRSIEMAEGLLPASEEPLKKSPPVLNKALLKKHQYSAFPELIVWSAKKLTDKDPLQGFVSDVLGLGTHFLLVMEPHGRTFMAKYAIVNGSRAQLWDGLQFEFKFFPGLHTDFQKTGVIDFGPGDETQPHSGLLRHAFGARQNEWLTFLQYDQWLIASLSKMRIRFGLQAVLQNAKKPTKRKAA